MRISACLLLCTFIISCTQAPTAEKPDLFQAFLSSIPEFKIPFTADNNHYLESQVVPDTAFHPYNDNDAQWIYGKTKVNDSIYAVIFLLAGDDVYPEIITYNMRGTKLSELIMTHTPGGSTGYHENGNSHVIMEKDFSIVITDTVYHFQRDSLHAVIDSTRTMEVIRACYRIDAKGKIKSVSSPRCSGK